MLINLKAITFLVFLQLPPTDLRPETLNDTSRNNTVRPLFTPNNWFEFSALSSADGIANGRHTGPLPIFYEH